MKKNLSLIAFCVLLTSHANAALQELWLDGVSFKGGWYDINKTWNGDGKLCWAAAASNIINWWQDRYVLPPGTPTGSAVWSTFKNSFENEGSSPQYAMEWWLSKTYQPQGDSRYYGYAQNTNASTGGYYQSVFNAAQAAGLVSSYEKSGGYSEEILNRLNAGYGLTLSIGDTTGGTRHAITLWGVEYDDVTSQLTKMYVTDSDDIRGSLNFNPGGIFEMTWLHQGWRQ